MRNTSLFITITLTSSLVTACLEPTQMNLPQDDGAGSSGGEATPDESSDDGETPSDETGTAAACDLETHACISNVPNGWNGPVALTDDACGGAFDADAIETYAALVVDPIQCGCDCGPPADGVCATETFVDIYPPYSVNGVSYNGGVCDTLEEQVTAVYAEPAAFPTNWNWADTYVVAHPVDVAVPGSCVATPTVDIPAFELEGVVHACESTDALDTCDDGSLCVPQPDDGFEDRVCIWAMGEQACPDGTDFVDREVHKTGVDDTRACTQCSCDAAVDESCDAAEVTLQRTGAGGSAIVDADGQCTYLDVGNYTWSTITLDPGTPSGGACQPRGGQVEGGISSQDQVTFCCT